MACILAAQAIATALKTNTVLTDLILTGKHIGDDGAIAIADAVRSNPKSSLKYLHLTKNGLRARGATAIAELLKVSTTLQSLFIVTQQGTSHLNNEADNLIGDEGMAAIAEALKVNTALTVLCVTSNSVGDRGLASLAEALKVNTVLAQIDIHDNIIGASGATALAEALKVSSCGHLRNCVCRSAESQHCA